MRRAELCFEVRNPPLGRIKSLPQRPDQRILFGVAQMTEVGERRHPAFRIESAVIVSTEKLLPRAAR